MGRAAGRFGGWATAAHERWVHGGTLTEKGDLGALSGVELVHGRHYLNFVCSPSVYDAIWS
jgi:hypothetical protein